MKVHLVQTTNPLNEGESATSLCGFVFFKVAIGAMCDAGEFPGVEIDSLLRGVCPKCQKWEWRDRYLYFVTEATDKVFEA